MADSILQNEIGSLESFDFELNPNTTDYSQGTIKCSKFQDGTMIQTCRMSLISSSSSSTGSFPYHKNIVVPFPVAFVGNIPSVFVGIDESAAYWNAGTAADVSGTETTLTETSISLGGDAASKTKTVTWIAIGRWR